MTTDLLRKEEEFRKLNDQLEEKSKYLLHEVDTIKLGSTINYNQKYIKNQQENAGSSKMYPAMAMAFTLHDKEYLYRHQDKSEIFGDSALNQIIPESVNNMGMKGINHFFRAKVKILQEDIERLQNDLTKKTEESKRLFKENEKLEEEKNKWFQISTSNKTHLSKLENQIAMLNSKIQSKENENIQLKKEVEELHKQVKSANLKVTNNDVKLIRTNEEREKLKETIKMVNQELKELKGSHKKQIDEITSITKKLDKHRHELIAGFKRQLQLIDNLRRQKALIANMKITQQMEKDFLKLLDWRFDE